MKVSDFDYTLPPQLIAQTPSEPRDSSRLMVVRRADGSIEHRHFFEIVEFLQPGDVLICNESRVIPARLIGRKVSSGGKVELLLLRRLEGDIWEALAKPGQRAGVGTMIEIERPAGQGSPPRRVYGEVLDKTEVGTRMLRFSEEEALEELGKVPLPPYIRQPLTNMERYQTVYARVKGSVAAPTAGLHFTPELIQRIQQKGIHFAFVTLHVGLDTFRPVRVDDPKDHPIHKEFCVLSEEVAQEINQAKAKGQRIICVGTTTVRVLEEAARHGESGEPEDERGSLRSPLLRPFTGWADIFILPGHRFKMADALVTNFHLPRSTTLMLVAAFDGKDLLRRCYQEAIEHGYRFYSFGDAMLLL